MAELHGLSSFGGASFEQCGLIIEKDGKRRVVKVQNSAENRQENYEITKLSIAIVTAKLRTGEKIVGILHTHLSHHSAEPSPEDWQGASENPGVLHAVYKPSTGELVWYMWEAHEGN